MGGVENFTKGLSSALERMGVHAIVATSVFGDAPEYEVDSGGLEVFRLPSFQLLGWKAPRREGWEGDEGTTGRVR